MRLLRLNRNKWFSGLNPPRSSGELEFIIGNKNKTKSHAFRTLKSSEHWATLPLFLDFLLISIRSTKWCLTPAAGFRRDKNQYNVRALALELQTCREKEFHWSPVKCYGAVERKCSSTFMAGNHKIVSSWDRLVSLLWNMVRLVICLTMTQLVELLPL